MSMLEDSIRNSPLYHYFLGTLSEPEQEQLEEEYFAQPERRQELWAIFDEMVERFVQGEMEAQEARQFAVQLQTKPFLRARAERLHTLYHFLSAASPQHLLTARTASEQHLNPLKNWFAFPAWGWGVLVAGILCLALGGLFLRRQTKEPEREIAQAQPSVASSVFPSVTTTPTPSPAATKPKMETPSPPAPRSGLASFYLLLAEARATRDDTPLSIAEQTQIIALHFEVPSPLQASYQGVAQTAQGQVFKSFPNLKVQKQNGTAFVILRLTVTEILTPDFTVHIKPHATEPNASPVVSHNFRLAKKQV